MDDNQEQQAVEPSLREELTKAMDDAVAKQPKPETPAKTDKTLSLPDTRLTDKPERADGRDETGKFVKKEAPPALVEAKKYAKPRSWSSDTEEKWGALPEDIQAIIDKREKEVEQGFTKLDDERKYGRTMRDAMQPFEAELRQAGVEPATYVRDLANTAAQLRNGTPQQKAAVIANIMRSYGVDPQHVGASLQQPQQFDPNQLRQQITQQVRNDLQSQYQADNVNQQITAFASDPAHTHYETVKGQMAALLSNGQAADLKDAYEQAIWANPQTRSMLVADMQSADLAKRQSEIAAKKAASPSITGSPGITPPNSGKQSQNLSLREQLSASYDAATG